MIPFTSKHHKQKPPMSVRFADSSCSFTTIIMWMIWLEQIEDMRCLANNEVVLKALFRSFYTSLKDVLCSNFYEGANRVFDPHIYWGGLHLNCPNKKKKKKNGRGTNITFANCGITPWLWSLYRTKSYHLHRVHSSMKEMKTCFR